MEPLLRRLDRLYCSLDRRLGGWPTLLARAVLAFGRDDGSTMSASIAYYALFSSFPLLLLLIALGSIVLDISQAQRLALELVERYVPAATALAQSNMEQILRARSVVSAAALVGLAWSASGVFGAIYRAVNRAWGQWSPGSFWRRRLYALAMMLSVGLIFVATTVYSTAVSFVRGWRVPILGWQPFADAGVGRLVGWLSALVPALISVAILAVIYRTMPRARVSWRDVWPGALAAGLLWEAAKQLFTWYLGNFARYSLVYGSVGAVIAFVLWSYMSATILLLGAEFTAQYAQWRQAGRPLETRPLREWIEEGSRWKNRFTPSS